MFRIPLVRSVASFLGVVAGVLLVPVAGRADGLLQQLPEEGSWVRFDIETQHFDRKTGALRESPKESGSLTISSVGKATVGVEACRYIEWKTVLKIESQD